MGKRRFLSVKYRNEIASETEEMIEGYDLEVSFGGTAGKETDSVELVQDTDNILLMLSMYSDERFKGSKPNYVIYGGMPEESNKIAEYEQINYAKQKWFDLVRQYAPDTDSGNNRELSDF